MADVVERAHFVFHKVRRPVLLAACSAEAVVRQCARPHEVGACIVVLRIQDDVPGFFDDGPHQTFTDVVGHDGSRRVREVAFHDVRQHVGDAACRLPGR